MRTRKRNKTLSSVSLAKGLSHDPKEEHSLKQTTLKNINEIKNFRKYMIHIYLYLYRTLSIYYDISVLCMLSLHIFTFIKKKYALYIKNSGT